MKKTTHKQEVIEYLKYAIRNRIIPAVMAHNLAEMYAKAFNESVSPANSKFPKNFKKVKADQWQQPVMNGYLMKCCDCGLVHKVDFRIAYGKTKEADRVQLKMCRITINP